MSHRTRGIIIGALSGALLGILIAWIYTNSQTENETGEGQGSAEIAPVDWIRLGIAILGVARQMGDLVRRA
ncbi:MAG: hypothetical protein GXP39_19405 [Chloroflexi bacterium]|nr:hypothetical protein [Chloroflexota bacterium]